MQVAEEELETDLKVLEADLKDLKELEADLKVLACSFNASNLSYDVFFPLGQCEDNTAKEYTASPYKVFPKMIIQL